MNSDKITYHCDVCGREVAGRDGWITISYTEMREYAERKRAWDAAQPAPEDTPWGPAQRLTLADLMDLPEPVRWRVLHAECDPDDGADYWFYVGRADTPAKLLDWTLHLMETKGWHADTDWVEFVRRHAGRADA